jgi:hypothetical protein
MNVRTSITAAGTVAALATGGCLLALPASAGSATHTIHFKALTKSQAGLGKHGGVSFDHDVTPGKGLIGYDVVSFVGKSSGDVAVGLKGGLLLAHLKFTKNGALSGSVTGGTGAYAHAKGTVSGQAISKKKTAVTVTYHR